METSISRVAEHQQRALDFTLDTLGLRQAYEAVAQLPEREELARVVVALQAESDAAFTAAICERDREHELDDI